MSGELRMVGRAAGWGCQMGLPGYEGRASVVDRRAGLAGGLRGRFLRDRFGDDTVFRVPTVLALRGRLRVSSFVGAGILRTHISDARCGVPEIVGLQIWATLR